MQSSKSVLLIAGSASFAISLLHIFTIIGGAEWYRFLGAGEEMARLDDAGSSYPALITSGIVMVFFLWGLYAYSAAGIIRKMPLIKIALIFISTVYIVRGLLAIFIVSLSSHPYAAELNQRPTFMVISSLISLGIGLLYAFGTYRYLTVKR